MSLSLSLHKRVDVFNLGTVTLMKEENNIRLKTSAQMKEYCRK